MSRRPRQQPQRASLLEAGVQALNEIFYSPESFEGQRGFEGESTVVAGVTTAIVGRTADQRLISVTPFLVPSHASSLAIEACVNEYRDYHDYSHTGSNLGRLAQDIAGEIFKGAAKVLDRRSRRLLGAFTLETVNDSDELLPAWYVAKPMLDASKIALGKRGLAHGPGSVKPRLMDRVRRRQVPETAEHVVAMNAIGAILPTPESVRQQLNDAAFAARVADMSAYRISAN